MTRTSFDDQAAFNAGVDAERERRDEMWKSMKIAPRVRPILVRRHNGVFYEYDIVWWEDSDLDYPWANDYTSYPLDRMDEWHEIPA